MAAGPQFTFAQRAGRRGDTVEITIVSADGRNLTVIARVDSSQPPTLVLSQVDVWGGGAGSIGTGDLMRMLDAYLREHSFEEVMIYGRRRTSGAGPGRIPKPVRYRRRAASRGRLDQG